VTPADEVLDSILTADWLASKNPQVDRLKVLTGALYQSRIDALSPEEHGILIAAEELSKMRALSRRLASQCPPVGDRRPLVDARNAAEDMVLALCHIRGVPEMLADVQRMNPPPMKSA
jgi:hypothetical protein